MGKKERDLEKLPKGLFKRKFNKLSILEKSCYYTEDPSYKELLLRIENNRKENDREEYGDESSILERSVGIF